MSQDTIILIFAGIMLVLTPFVPKFVRIRIKFLHWLKWDKIADWHERNTPILVPVVQVFLVFLAITLVIIVAL